MHKNNENVCQYELALTFLLPCPHSLHCHSSSAVKEEDEGGGTAVKPPLKRYSSMTGLLSSLSWDNETKLCLTSLSSQLCTTRCILQRASSVGLIFRLCFVDLGLAGYLLLLLFTRRLPLAISLWAERSGCFSWTNAGWDSTKGLPRRCTNTSHCITLPLFHM